jgi:glucose-1-phosphate cytidylyltransferase
MCIKIMPSLEVTLVDTGENTMTGGRLRRVAKYLGDEDFCFTYGDGVGTVDIRASIEFHKSHGKQATVTAVQPPRFGALEINGSSVNSFMEKPTGDGAYINGGFRSVAKGNQSHQRRCYYLGAPASGRIG